ncbi:hypothetical protein D187_003703 [Cystobacter fuscus DSM 2262]|uniref:Uncharacterized protein n=1 Tax=Cystobacter fuscus (strain ATCC 25194 / DSM 2262 / NBRC 100088 / M29) TaxID=1242864 RepID=S9P901_CYSF2|nr:hypothetical protein [Cystobacter fuscus]EPX58742.1 hypothetical protein D187_003703 [Cystobacter fuscus DSM 2262]
MRKDTAARQPSQAEALTRTKPSFHAASALLLSAALAGCGGSPGEAGVAGASLEEGQAESALELREGSGGDTTSAPTLACAPLCNGSCTPIDLATINTNGAINIALTDQYVYYGGGYGSEVSNDEVGRVPKAGGAKTVLINRLTYVTELVGSGPYAYFSGSGRGLGSNLNRVNPDGTITALPVTGGYPSGVAVDSTHIYWIGNNQYNIYAQPLSGGTASLVVPHDPVQGGLRTSLFADGDSLYYRELGSLSSTMKAPKSGAAAPIKLTRTSWYLDFDDANVYYAASGVYRIPKSGGTAVKLAATGTRVVVDSERIYWLDGTALRAMCKDGTGAQVLASTGESYNLAVDSTGVYWAGEGKIRKIAK